jgi:HNH endonuclease
MYPEYNIGNAQYDITKITVNAFSRGHYQTSAAPRRTNTGHQWDLLYKRRLINGLIEYEAYRPDHHPLWELYRDEGLQTKGKVRARPVAVGPWADDLNQAQRETDETGCFDPSNELDDRKRVMRSIVSRRGQQRFREALLEAYDGACAMTGSTAVDVLEAAHILPYKGDHTNATQNGLLLRSDIHTLFDLGHLWIRAGKICVAAHLYGTEYQNLSGQPLRKPRDTKSAPSIAALEQHAEIATGKAGGCWLATRRE